MQIESEAVKTANFDMPDTFEALNHIHPLYVIRSEREYYRAHGVAKRLSLRGEDLTAGQLRYLDALAVLMPIRPELFQFERCNVTIVSEGPQTGRPILSACGQGEVAIATSVDVASARQEILNRLLHHTATRPTP